MRFLVWAALAIAGIGYWWYDYRRWQKTHIGVPYNFQYEDAQDTADHVARFYEEAR